MIYILYIKAYINLYVDLVISILHIFPNKSFSSINYADLNAILSRKLVINPSNRRVINDIVKLDYYY